MILFHCPQCGVHFKLPDAHAGRKGKCKKCGSVIEIPRPIEAAQDPPDIYALADEPVAAAAPPASPSYQQPVSSPEEQNKLAQPCPSCMRRLEPGAKICVTCGIYVPSGRPVMTSRFVDTDELIVKAENIIKPISWLVALGIYPILSEAGGRCKPYATWGIAALTILVSIWFWSMEWSNSTSMRWAKNLML